MLRTILCLFILLSLFRGCLHLFGLKEIEAEKAIDLIKTKIRPEKEFPQMKDFVYVKNNQITIDNNDFYYISFYENKEKQIHSLKSYFVRKDGKQIYEINKFGKNTLIWSYEKKSSI